MWNAIAPCAGGARGRRWRRRAQRQQRRWRHATRPSMRRTQSGARSACTGTRATSSPRPPPRRTSRVRTATRRAAHLLANQHACARTAHAAYSGMQMLALGDRLALTGATASTNFLLKAPSNAAEKALQGTSFVHGKLRLTMMLCQSQWCFLCSCHRGARAGARAGEQVPRARPAGGRGARARQRRRLRRTQPQLAQPLEGASRLLRLTASMGCMLPHREALQSLPGGVRTRAT